jgi:hypothetical protein
MAGGVSHVLAFEECLDMAAATHVALAGVDDGVWRVQAQSSGRSPAASASAHRRATSSGCVCWSRPTAR